MSYFCSGVYLSLPFVCIFIFCVKLNMDLLLILPGSFHIIIISIDTGYMLSFSFNKNKKPGVERVNVGDKVLFEGTV